MRVVLAQMSPAAGDIPANLAAIEETISEHAHADLVAFPELCLGGYNMLTTGSLAVDVDGPEVGRIRRAAEATATAVVAGLAEATKDRPANTAVVIDQTGNIAGLYRKTHLFGAEQDAFTAGTELEPIALGDRRLGLMICFDVEFPEVARTLAARGADLLITISCNMSPFGPDHALAARARALENGLPHLYVNRVGLEAGLEFIGESQVVNTWGRPIVSAGADPCTLEVQVGERGPADERLNYARQLRPELYQLNSRESTYSAAGGSPAV